MFELPQLKFAKHVGLFPSFDRFSTSFALAHELHYVVFLLVGCEAYCKFYFLFVLNNS